MIGGPVDFAGSPASMWAAEWVGKRTTWWSKSVEKSYAVLGCSPIAISIHWSRNEGHVRQFRRCEMSGDIP